MLQLTGVIWVNYHSYQVKAAGQVPGFMFIKVKAGRFEKAVLFGFAKGVQRAERSRRMKGTGFYLNKHQSAVFIAGYYIQLQAGLLPGSRAPVALQQGKALPAKVPGGLFFAGFSGFKMRWLRFFVFHYVIMPCRQKACKGI